jgi:hypothetical protein
MIDKNYLSANTPDWPLLADLKYPQEVQKAIDKAEKDWNDWAEADTAHAVAIDDLVAKRNEFEQAIISAARNGKPRPESPDMGNAEDDLKYLAEVANTKRVRVQNSIQEIKDLLRTHRFEIAQLAIEKAELGISKFRESIQSVASTFSDIEQERRAAYDGLRMMSDLTTPELRFSPDFGVPDSPQLPRTHENGAKSVIANLRAFIARNEPRDFETDSVSETDDQADD